jgi:hypothetical protein
MTKHFAAAGLWIVATLLVPPPGAAQIDVVALKDGASPEAGFVYRKFQRPAVGDAVADPVGFFAKARGNGTIRGIFTDAPASAGGTVVLADDPGPESRLFKRFGNPTINADGDVAFDALLTGGSKGVFRSGPTVVTFLGDTVPSVTGQLDGFTRAHIIDGGDVVFHGTISGPANVGGIALDEGIFRCTGGDGNCSTGTGSLEVVVLKNDPVADRAGREFCRFLEVAASTFGAAFVAETKEDCGDGAEVPRRGVFRLPFGGSVVTVALEGEVSEPDPTPGSGTTYQVIVDRPDIAGDGTIVFKARTTGLLVNTNLYVCDVATCPVAPAEAAVLQGTTDPGGNAFTGFGPPAVSDSGDVAFTAGARGPGGRVRGMYVRRSGGALEILALEGDGVPGLVPLATFKGFRERIDVSPGGRLAFEAQVKTDLPPRKTRPGLFLADLSGSPSVAFLEPATGLLD